MNDINTWCGIPSETNPCLLKIMPGVYDIGSRSVVVQQFVDIEGAGWNVTKIIGDISNSLYYGVFEFREYQNVEVRNISIENKNELGASIWVGAYEGSKILLKDVKLSSAHTALVKRGDSLLVIDSSYIEQSNPSASYLTGIYSSAWSVASGLVIKNSELILNGKQDCYGITGIGEKIKVMNTIIKMSCYANTAINTIKGMIPIDEIDIEGTTIIFNNASGTGIINKGSKIIMNNSSVLISGGSYTSYGIINSLYLNTPASTQMSNVLLNINGYAIYQEDQLGRFDIDRSTINGIIYCNGVVKIATTKISGQMMGEGFFSCFGNYDSDLNNFNCP